MNEKIVPYLLEGMKGVAKEQYVSPFPCFVIELLGLLGGLYGE